MPAHSDKSGSIDNGVNQDGPGWKSRQRTTLPALPRLQHGISFSNVYNKDRKENFDGLTDSFVNLIYKRNTPKIDRPASSSSRTDVVNLMKSDYSYPRDKSSYNPERTKVIRRTLSPIVKYETLYATKDMSKRRTEPKPKHKYSTDKDQTKVPTGYTMAGLSFGKVPYIETNPKDIMVTQLHDGISRPTMENIYEIMKRKRSVTEELDLLDRNHGPVHNYLLELRKNVRQNFKRSFSHMRKAKGNLRQTNASLSRGTREMYRSLHETEHRLLHIQAGGSYSSHLKACRKRRSIEEKMRSQEDSSQPHFVKKPASSGGKTALYTDEEAKTKLPMFSRVKDAALHTAKDIATKRRKQIYFEKLCDISTILTVIKKMKQPNPDCNPLPPRLLKKYRENPDILAEASLAVQNTRSPTPVISFANRKTKSQTSTKDRKVTISPEVKVSSPTTQHRVSSDSSPTTQRRASSNRKSPVRSRTSSVAPHNKRKSEPRVRVSEGKRRPLTPETNHQNLAEGIFDPATITWSEFLKVGVKTAPKSAAVSSQVQRAKSAKWTEQVTKIQSEIRQRERLTKVPQKATAPSLRKSVNAIWQVLRKSFMQNLSDGSAHINMAEMGFKETNPLLQVILSSHSKIYSAIYVIARWKVFLMDQMNSVDHCQLNWLKIKSRSDKDLYHKIRVRNIEAESHYEAIKSMEEINKTHKWKHRWSMDFQIMKQAAALKEQDQYVECLDVLRDEADELEVSHKEPVRLILTKIQRLCNTPTIKHTTIFTGQIKVKQIVLSLPAYEICTPHMQEALQYVLVDVLHGETDLLSPMIQIRGLPIHPAIQETSKRNSYSFLPVQSKQKVADYEGANKKLSTLPPAKAVGR